MATLNLSSSLQTFSVGTSTSVTGALCEVTANGSVVFSKVLHPSPTGSLILNLVYILSSAISNPTTASHSCSYSVTYDGSSIDSGTFSYNF